MLPSIFGENLFDDWMEPFEKELRKAVDSSRNALYGKRGANLMKTDVREKGDAYEVDVDLPGFKKEDVRVSLDKGYLTIQATRGVEKEETDELGRYIRRERTSGQCSRTFFIGDKVKQEEIRAKFENGILRLTMPKKEIPAPQENLIDIEG